MHSPALVPKCSKGLRKRLKGPFKNATTVLGHWDSSKHLYPKKPPGCSRINPLGDKEVWTSVVMEIALSSELDTKQGDPVKGNKQHKTRRTIQTWKMKTNNHIPWSPTYAKPH